MHIGNLSSWPKQGGWSVQPKEDGWDEGQVEGSNDGWNENEGLELGKAEGIWLCIIFVLKKIRIDQQRIVKKKKTGMCKFVFKKKYFDPGILINLRENSP